MNQREFKFIFAPLGVVLGLAVFIVISLSISHALQMQNLSDLIPFIPTSVFIFLGSICLFIFLPIFIAGIYYLNRRGAVGQSSALQTNGIYQYVRNPMYIGISMVMIGMGLILFHTGIIMSGLLWFCITFLQCKREEKELYIRFGKEYAVYKSQTPLFIPNIRSLVLDVFERRKRA